MKPLLSCGLVTSISTARALSDPSSSTRALSRSSRRAPSATFAPASTSNRDTSPPIPELAPVIAITFPFVAQDIDPDLFTDAAYTDETGRTHTWRVADTTVDLPTNDAGEVFTMRQVSLTVPGTKTGREGLGQDATRQIHILTTRTDLGVEEVIYRMGSRWRQENYFRYARMHFDLDSHDAYNTTDDDPTRMVPNPAKKKAHAKVLAARARYDRALAATDAALLDVVTPPPG